MLELIFIVHHIIFDTLQVVVGKEAVESYDFELSNIYFYLLQISLYCQHPLSGNWMDTKLEVNKNKTLSQATEIAWKVMEYIHVT